MKNKSTQKTIKTKTITKIEQTQEPRTKKLQHKNLIIIRNAKPCNFHLPLHHNRKKKTHV